MKVLMIHVGNEVLGQYELQEEFYLKRKRLIDGEMALFLKHDIINADTQMQSLVDAGIEVEYGHYSNRKSFLGMIRTGFKIRKETTRVDIDLVHVLWGSTTGLMTCIFSKKPVVISFCGSDLLGTKKIDGSISIGGKFNRLVSRLASCISTWNVTKSNQMASILPKTARNKTTIIPNGVKLDGFFPMTRNKACKILNWSIEKKYVLFFYTEGQVVKNPNMAFKVFKKVKEKINNAELIIATKIPHEQLLYYYNATDVMILTSYHEGSNNSLKEAKACNLPIVSVNVGDAQERLMQVHNSFVVDTWDTDEFSEKVIKVLLSGNRSNGVASCDDVSIQNIAEQVIHVYSKVLSYRE